MVFRVFLSLCCYSDYFRSNMYVLCLYMDGERTCFCSIPVYRCMPYRLIATFTRSPFHMCVCVIILLCFGLLLWMRSIPHLSLSLVLSVLWHFCSLFYVIFHVFISNAHTKDDRISSFSFFFYCLPVSMIFSAKEPSQWATNVSEKYIFPIRLCFYHLSNNSWLLLIFIRLFFYDFCWIFM